MGTPGLIRSSLLQHFGNQRLFNRLLFHCRAANTCWLAIIPRASFIPPKLGSPVLEPHLNSSLAKPRSFSQVLPDKSIRIVCSLKNLLKGTKLAVTEGCSVPPGLLLVIILTHRIILGLCLML